MAHRQAVAAALQGRARATGSAADSRVWEQYVLKTSAMATTAHVLPQTLPPDFRVAHGLRVIFQGREIYLEHVVTGPTGVYLLETQSEGDPAWLKDLDQNLAFFRAILGGGAQYFAALVVLREPLREALPPGAHPVESVEVAAAVMTQPGGVPVSPVVIDQVWSVLEALAPLGAQGARAAQAGRVPQAPRAGAPGATGTPGGPFPPGAPGATGTPGGHFPPGAPGATGTPGAPFPPGAPGATGTPGAPFPPGAPGSSVPPAAPGAWGDQAYPITLPPPAADKSLPRLIWATVILAVLANLSCSVALGDEDRTLMFVVGLFLVVGPAAGVAALIRILPWRGVRKGGMIAWLVIVGLVFLVMLLMMFTYEAPAAGQLGALP